MVSAVDTSKIQQVKEVQAYLKANSLGGIVTDGQIAQALDRYEASAGQQASARLGLGAPSNTTAGTQRLGDAEQYTKKLRGSVSPEDIGFFKTLMQSVPPPVAAEIWKGIINQFREVGG
jgi:hypothetical protein